MKRIVFTGGPSSGKTTIMRELQEKPNLKAVFVPETAALLLEGGYPKPGDLLPWSEAWHLLFEDAIFHLQESIENASLLKAAHNNRDLVIFDRGVLDVAGHLPGGMNQFCQSYGVTEEECLQRYDVVIHLVSFARFNPDEYQKMAEVRWTEKSYFTSVEHALNIEQTTLAVWANHKNRFIVDGQGSLERKMAEVAAIIENTLA